MFANPYRTAAYLAAIGRAVHPGSVVVEIGTGLGYFAIAACHAGARRVYAIETNPVVGLAKDVAAENGCADRITFIRNDSRETTLPELGDVLLSDLRGVLPPYTSHIQTIIDARARLLRPGATLVPRRDTLWAAPCVASSSWRTAFSNQEHPAHAISRRAVTALIRSDWYRTVLDQSHLLADGVEWAALQYDEIASPNVGGSAAWTFARDGNAEGVAVWFDADFGFGVTLSNSPAAPSALYKQAFFPFERELPVRANDRLQVDFAAYAVNGDYVWSWNTTLTPGATGARAVAFKQTNVGAHIVSLEYLHEHDSGNRLRKDS